MQLSRGLGVSLKPGDEEINLNWLSSVDEVISLINIHLETVAVLYEPPCT